jgi:hypothetical protein
MAIEIQAPNHYPREGFLIFLAGAIDMGKAEDWQKQVVEELASFNVTVLNPRRNDWDSSWEQVKENPQFREQVNWELDGMNASNLIVFFIGKKSKAPITLLEIGLHASDDIMMCCEEGFYRKGNIDIVCERHGVPVYEDLDVMLEDLKTLLTDQGYKSK